MHDTRDSGLGTRVARLVAAVACLASAACARAQGPSPQSRVPSPGSYTKADTARLRATLDSLAGAHRGVLGYTVWNLDTGERLERHDDSYEELRRWANEAQAAVARVA